MPAAEGLTIEPAREPDVPLIHDLIRALADYERLSDIVTATEADLRETLFGAQPAAEAAVARVGGVPAGYALWFHTYSTFLGRRGLYLEDLFVRPEWRGRGIGRALLAHLAGIAVERGCGRMEWAVLDWNAPAIGFYEGLGARRLEDWRIFRITGAALEGLAAGRARQA